MSAIYIRLLAQNLKNHGKELKVEEWEYLHEKLDYESWDELADYEKMSDEVVADEKMLEEWIFDRGKSEVLELEKSDFCKGLENSNIEVLQECLNREIK